MFDKFVTFLVTPLGTSMLLWLLALACLGGASPGARRGARWAGAAGLLWLWLWATPVASDALRATLERQATARLVEDGPAGDVIVVLGGSIAAARPPARPYADLHAASDRLWHAARLFHAGKAPLVLVSGGAWFPGLESEAPAMRAFLQALGVPAQAVLLEGASANTAQNAGRSADILRARNLRRVILVTSALHMPRARRAFERAGIAVTPAPTDFEVAPGPFDPLDLLPTASALEGSGRAMKEWVGAWAGR